MRAIKNQYARLAVTYARSAKKPSGIQNSRGLSHKSLLLLSRTDQYFIHIDMRRLLDGIPDGAGDVFRL